MLASADAGVLEPTKRNLRFAADGRGVYVQDAGLDLIDVAEDAANVAGVDR